MADCTYGASKPGKGVFLAFRAPNPLSCFSWLPGFLLNPNQDISIRT
jgi:hypothetical protein